MQAYQQPGNDTVKLVHVITDVYWVSHYNSSVQCIIEIKTLT